MKFLKPHLTDIQALCKKHKVAELYVFGSVIEGDFKETSDVDFLVEFDWSDTTNLLERLVGLKEDLESQLNRKVDLVCASAIRNPYFRQAVEASKEQVYAA